MPWILKNGVKNHATICPVFTCNASIGMKQVYVQVGTTAT